jgi:integrase
MPKINVIRDNIVDDFELLRILKACKDDKKLLFAVAIAWETGARISEIIQLRPKDFSEEEGMWIVSVPTLKQRQMVHGQAPKRILPIKKDWVYEKVIKPELLRQKDMDKPVVFPYSRFDLSKKISRRYPDVYFHWFRHTRSTMWSRKVSIFQLQYLMGWRDIRMANTYVHQEQMAQQLKGLI